MLPIALFDKSFIEMMNIEESTLFDNFYYTNICPYFFVEVLGDLQKTKGGRNAHKIVSDVAKKSPCMNSYPNRYHFDLCAGELFGEHIPMNGVIIVPPGEPINHDGKMGEFVNGRAELVAFQRWQQEKFSEVEEFHAKVWRGNLNQTNLREQSANTLRKFNISKVPSTKEEAYEIAKSVVFSKGNKLELLQLACMNLGFNKNQFKQIKRFWISKKRPVLSEFAPYTTHCLLVDIFFAIAVSKTLISPDRVSNKIDIAYFYYLPFCNCFISNDKLHRRMTPLFLRDDQSFVFGQDLKNDLANIVGKFARLPVETQENGTINFKPPQNRESVTSKLWEQYGSYGIESTHEDLQANPELHDKLLKFLMPHIPNESSEAKIDYEFQGETEFNIERRMMPSKIGKLQILPKKNSR